MGTFEAHSAFAQPREGTPEPLVYLLKQSLTETLELAFQTERAHSHAKDESSHELRQVFDHLHGQLASYADDFNKRAVQLGDTEAGRLLGSLSAR